MSSLDDQKRMKMIMDQYSLRAASHVAQLILKCLESDHRKRPSMVEVLATLEKAQTMKYKPKGNKASAMTLSSYTSIPSSSSVTPILNVKNTVFSFFVPPPYIIRKLFLDPEVFLRFIKSKTLFCI